MTRHVCPACGLHHVGADSRYSRCRCGLRLTDAHLVRPVHHPLLVWTLRVALVLAVVILLVVACL